VKSLAISGVSISISRVGGGSGIGSGRVESGTSNVDILSILNCSVDIVIRDGGTGIGSGFSGAGTRLPTLDVISCVGNIPLFLEVLSTHGDHMMNLNTLH
jgi:hypothetical protein